jgi:hypothetical protein
MLPQRVLLTMFLMNRVYIVIRVFIQVVEIIFSRPKHRRFRQQMAKSNSYSEWYMHASELDKSQKRDRWLDRVDDETCRRYNWTVIRQLMKNMSTARSQGDSIIALVVLQQCIRRNVGGVMSADLFSYPNTGQPKYLVTEFVEEVVKTIRWVTEEATKLPAAGENDTAAAGNRKAVVHRRLSQQRRKTIVDHSVLDINEELIIDNESEIPESGSTLSVDEVSAFLKRARASYGRTALCLSGGAMMGLYRKKQNRRDAAAECFLF